MPHIWAWLECVTESWVVLICDLTAAGNELKLCVCVQCLLNTVAVAKRDQRVVQNWDEVSRRV